MTALLITALLASFFTIWRQRQEIKDLEAEHDRLCDLLQERRP